MLENEVLFACVVVYLTQITYLLPIKAYLLSFEINFMHCLHPEMNLSDLDLHDGLQILASTFSKSVRSPIGPRDPRVSLLSLQRNSIGCHLAVITCIRSNNRSIHATVRKYTFKATPPSMLENSRIFSLPSTAVQHVTVLIQWSRWSLGDFSVTSRGQDDVIAAVCLHYRVYWGQNRELENVRDRWTLVSHLFRLSLFSLSPEITIAASAQQQTFLLLYRWPKPKNAYFLCDVRNFYFLKKENDCGTVSLIRWIFNGPRATILSMKI